MQQGVFIFALITLLSFVEIGLCQQVKQVEIYENSPQENLRIAQNLIEQNKEDSAISYLDACLNKKYEYPEALFLRARIYNNQNKLNLAHTDYNMLLALEPDNKEALYFRGLIRYRLTQFGPAIEDFIKVLNLPDAETQTAFFKIQQGQTGASGIATLSGMKADIWNNIGLCYQATGNANQAIEAYNKGIEIDPETPDLYINRALSFEKSGKNKLALNDYRYVLSIVPDHPIAQYNLMHMQNEEEFGKQLNFLNQFIDQHPNMAQGYAERGLFFYESLDYKAALEDFEKSLEIDPGNIDYLFNLALAHEKLNQVEKAELLFDQVISLDINHAGAYFNLGNIQFKREAYLNAISLFTIAHQLDNENSAILYNRAIAQYQIGKIDAACEDMELLRKLDTDLGEKFYRKNCSDN